MLTYTIKKLSDDATYLRFYDGQVYIGSCYISIKRFSKEPSYVYISDFIILYEHRGKKLAKPMLSLIEKYAVSNNIWNMVLSVLKNNMIAINLYRSYGFVVMDDMGTICDKYIKKIQ